MRTVSKALLILVFTGLLFCFQNADVSSTSVSSTTIGSCSLPNNVRNRIGRALTWGNTSFDRSLLPGSRDFIWGDSVDGAKYSDVFSGRYLPNSRDPDKNNGLVAYTDGTFCSKYFQTNSSNAYDPKPDQVVYKCDGLPAVGPRLAFAYPGTVLNCAAGGIDTTVSLPNYYKTPLDVANPNVQLNQFCKYVSPFFPKDLQYSLPNSTASKSCLSYFPVTRTGSYTGFDGIALDNVVPWNGNQGCGVKSQSCTKPLVNGVCPKYTGARIDAAFTADVASWMAWLTSQAHLNNRCTVANLKYHNDYQNEFSTVAPNVDIVLYEGGFVRNDAKDGTCLPRASFLNTAKSPQVWTDMINRFLTVTRNAKQGVVILDQNCRDASGKFDPKFSDWTMANYLMIKGDHTYLSNEGDSFPTDIPDFYIPVGKALTNMQLIDGVYWRQFDNALALVNPSETVSATYDLGSGAWYDSFGTINRGKITIPASSARVLLSAAWSFDGLQSKASQPNSGIAQALPFSETSTTGAHRVSLYISGSASTYWTATARFKTSDVSRGVKIQLLNAVDQTNNLSAVCKADGTSSAVTLKGAAASAKTSSRKLEDGSVLCRITGIPGGPEGVSRNIRLVASVVQGTLASYAGNPSILTISDLHIEPMDMPSTAPLSAAK